MLVILTYLDPAIHVSDVSSVIGRQGFAAITFLGQPRVYLDQPLWDSLLGCG